jgi:2',3'-cyclic-nucleotide 2'-phosphodiesterase (5'-nucleotidase family)
LKRLITALALVLVWLVSTGANKKTVEIDVLYTSDIHGHLGRAQATFLNPEFPPPLGGAASASTYIQGVREEAKRSGRSVLLFDCGDLFQGTPLGMETRGTAVIEWMNEIGYDAMVLGNHEFDLGWENAKRLVELAKFPVITANLYDAETGQRVPWVRDHVIFDCGGIRIGVLGYITETTTRSSFAKNVEGLEFRPIHEHMPADAEALRQLGADLVFAMIHCGLPYKPEKQQAFRQMLKREEAGELPHWGMNAMELAHMVRGVDVMFGGDTHQGYDEPWEDPHTHTLVFEPYANGSCIGHVTFQVDLETRSLIGFKTHFSRGALLTLFEEEIWPDAHYAQMIETKVAAAEAGLDEVIGETEIYLQRGNAGGALLGFVIADAYHEELGADFAIQNLGGVRADIPAGRITERDLLLVSPFGNHMVIVEMDGRLLRQVLEDKLRGRGSGIFISGGQVVYDLDRSEGDRIVSFTIDGLPIDPDREYRVAMSDYLAEGNSGLSRLRDVPSEKILYTGLYDRQLLKQYIQRKGVLHPTNDKRWIQEQRLP